MNARSARTCHHPFTKAIGAMVGRGSWRGTGALRIAVVEDNRGLGDAIADALRDEGHGVDRLHDGAEADTFLAREDVDLVVLDINLPGRTGLEVLAAMRRRGAYPPVLLVTARDALDDKLAGLDGGADDYLVKPFEMKELLARARVLLRRAMTGPGEREAPALRVGDVSLDPLARRVSVNGAPIDLTRREMALAELFITRAGHVVSKAQILDHLYGAGSMVEDGAAELAVHRLRKRLAHASVEIRTLRGLGYALRAPA